MAADSERTKWGWIKLLVFPREDQSNFIRFTFPTSNNGGDEQHAVVGPDTSCFNVRYGRTNDDAKCSLFFHAMERIYAHLIEDNSVSTNFLSDQLYNLEPSFPCDPFYLFGIDLLCAETPSAVFLNENIQESFTSNPPQTTLANDISEFIQKTLQLTDKILPQSSHPLTNIVYGCRIDITGMNEQMFRKHSNNHAFQQFWGFIQVQLQGTNAQVEERIRLFDDKKLQNLVMLIASMDEGLVTLGETMLISQLKNTKLQNSLGHICSSDLNFQMPTCWSTVPMLIDNMWTHIEMVTSSGQNALKYSDFGSEGTDDEDGLVEWSKQVSQTRLQGPTRMAQNKFEMKLKLVFQSFEQIFGTMMNSNIGVTGKRVVNQGGLIVHQKVAHILVLSLDTEVYTHLKEKCHDARSTIEYFRTVFTPVPKESKPWCRFYIVALEYNLDSILLACRNTYSNFCGAYT